MHCRYAISSVCLLILGVWILCVPRAVAQETMQTIPHIKPRLLVLTDISNEPDDEESLVRLLVYSEQFDIEGLIATTSNWLRNNPREDLIRRDIAAYSKVRMNLMKHAAGFPEADQLLAVACSGQTNFGMAAVGEGKSTPGSRQIIHATDREDGRPLWITLWCGANTLAQALRDVRASRSPSEVDAFVEKLRVYSISDQDDAGAWIRHEFPKLFYIVSPSAPTDGLGYYRSTWAGISGDRFYHIGLGHDIDMVENPWLEKYVIQNHGALGALYPPLKFIMEGDTPSFLGLINHGLGWEISPAYGGWGGRYAWYQPSGETRPIWTDNSNSRDRVTADNGLTETSNAATIWRWREHFQNDFAARMVWCVTDDIKKANHNPQPVLNGNRSTDVVVISARGGSTVKLSAEGTDAGDEGQQVKVTWWIYCEAGNLEGATLSNASGLKTEVALPVVRQSGSVHVILQAEDNGQPPLFAYRRIMIKVSPERLSDTK